jgi:RNA polymerase sigma-70 factor (ECF subfamily)
MSDLFRSADSPPSGINQISTRWPLIQDPARFVFRYAPAIQGYLGVFLKNPHDVEDTCQAILLRIVERGLVTPDQLRGRFRDYLIATVRNAALAKLRSHVPEPAGMPVDALAAPEAAVYPSDEEWISRWRRVVMAGAWEALENHERANPGSLCHAVLRALIDHPQDDSQQLAARVSDRCGRTISAEAFRKQVSRARRLFAEFLVAETARTLENPTATAIEDELIDIGLMKYVKPFLPPDWRTSGKLLPADRSRSEFQKSLFGRSHSQSTRIPLAGGKGPFLISPAARP